MSKEDTPASGGHKSAVALAIELAYRAAEVAHRHEAESAAAWVERWGSRFTDECFEEMLLTWTRLTDDDLAELREFRAELIERRAAA